MEGALVQWIRRSDKGQLELCNSSSIPAPASLIILLPNRSNDSVNGAGI